MKHMEEGSVELFAGIRLAVTVAVMCLVGASVSWFSSLSGLANREELSSAADTVTEALLDIQAVPPSTVLRRPLPQLRGVTIEIEEETENLIRIRISGRETVERYVFSPIRLDGGARGSDPRFIEVERGEKIRVRLVP
ncbi:MAG: hypothetical protein QW567_03260 [Candidatus Hadarchaeales archaeon]